MAEFVEKRLLETIPEIEEMEMMGLISNKERRKLILKRRDFEYRIARRGKSINDFLSYVAYERTLLRLIYLRRQKLGSNDNQRQIEQTISLRLMKQLRFMTRLWSDRCDIWSLRITFAKELRWKSEVSVAYRKWIGFHGNDPNLWVAWAKWEVEGQKNFDKAREILLTLAPQYIPKRLILHRELFRLELLFVEYLMHKEENNNIVGMEEVIMENREKVLTCAVARAVFEDSVVKLPEPSMYMELYRVAVKYPFALDLAEDIFENFSQKFPKDIDLWKLRAQRAGSGLQDLPAKAEEENEVLDQLTEKISSDILIKNDANENEGDDIKKDTSLEDNSKENVVPTSPSKSKVKTSKKNQEILKENLSPINKLNTLLVTLDKALGIIGEKFTGPYIEELMPLLYDAWATPILSVCIINKILEICLEHKKHLTLQDFMLWYQLEGLNGGSIEDKQIILDEALEKYPASASLLLEKLRLFTAQDKSDKKVIKAFDKMKDKLSHEIGIEAWNEVLNRITNNSIKNKLLQEGCYSTDEMISKHIRVKHLELVIQNNKGLKEARELYKTLNFMPPFGARLHTKMLHLELQQTEPSTEHIREVLEIASQQFGASQCGFWLVYIWFEKQKGDPVRADGLRSRAGRVLEPKAASNLANAMYDIRQMVENKQTSDVKNETEEFNTEPSIEEKNDDYKPDREALLDVTDFTEMLTYTGAKERNKFFNIVNLQKKSIEKEESSTPRISSSSEEDNKSWEQLLSSIIGGQFFINTSSPSSNNKKKKKNKKSGNNLVNKETSNVAPRFSKGYVPSDQLNPEDDIDEHLENGDGNDNEVDDMLKKSQTLEPGYINQATIQPFYINKKKAKAERKKERESTAGPGWFNMKAPEMTEEVERDLQVLKMRSVLDPKRHYNKSSMKVTPKFFQMGTYVDAPEDYYSSRVTKKHRKRTIAEELIHNEDVLRYQKKKCTEIVAAKMKKQFRHPPKSKGGKNKSAGHKKQKTSATS